MWIIFEGLDKAGKTTLEWSFQKATTFECNVVDRGPVGYIAFDKLFGRETPDRVLEYLDLLTDLNVNDSVLVVLCMVDHNIAKKRLKEHNEDCPYDYKKANNLLLDLVQKNYCNDKLLILDTGKNSIEECTDIIVDFYKRKKSERDEKRNTNTCKQS